MCGGGTSDLILNFCTVAESIWCEQVIPIDDKDCFIPSNII